MFNFPLTKSLQQRKTASNCKTPMKSKIVSIGSYVWLFLLDFPQTEIACWNQGCGVGVMESESEGFSTWGVGVAENFNDSDSGKTFCSPIVTVCATNVRKRHTWQQLDASTRDDHGYSDRR